VDKSSVVVPGVFFAMILAGCGGGGSTGTFSTSVPGDRPLNGLSSSEIATLCADLANYSSNSTLKRDNCRLTGFLTASLASSMSTATDAELQAACSQISTSCLTTTPNCPVPAPADCTATVAELTACASDSAAQTHLLASQVPACTGINRTAIKNATSSVGSALVGQPASCQAYEAKCSSSGSGSTGDGGSGPPDGGVGN
jgi:hypothetical protein